MINAQNNYDNDEIGKIMRASLTMKKPSIDFNVARPKDSGNTKSSSTGSTASSDNSSTA